MNSKQVASELRRCFLVLIVALMGFSLVPSHVFAVDCPDGMSQLDCEALYGPWENWVPDDGSSSSSCGDTTGSDPLPGADNAQKAFNYLVDKGLSDMHSAAIVGNLVQESGVNPKANQGGGGGKGIVQWTESERWQVLLKFAALPENQGRDVYSLDLQLDFMWAELHGTPPAGDYSAAFKKFQQQTSIEDATGFFMGTSAVRVYDPAVTAFMEKYGRVVGYENPGEPALDKRIDNAIKALGSYGDVSGSDGACSAAGSVNCNSEASNEGNISPLRQKVVCLAEAELALWKSGEMKPGSDFYKYTNNGRQDEQWCGDFISWIYNEAGYPVKDVGDHWERVAFGFRSDANTLKKFEYHPVGHGYVPQPGDVAIHSYSHVNIVVSINTSGKNPTVTVIGGNQDGDVVNTGTDSKVTKYSYTGYGGDSVTGYASPKGDEL